MKALLLALGAALLASATQAFAQQEPADLKDFGLICFCTSRVATPHGLVAMDNNGRLLNLARKPVSKAEMAANGLAITDSQLRMLRDWGLLVKNGERFETNIPVLGPTEMTALRARLKPVAQTIAGASAPDAAIVVRELARRRQPASAYAVMFGYILDGLVWRELGAAGKLPKQEISIERPFWDGTFWAVWPKQDAMPGTNDFSVGDAGFRMMWTPPVVDRYARLANAPEIRAWVGKIAQSAAGAALPPAPPGSPLRQAVVIDERGDDPIFAAGQRIARRTAQGVLATPLDDVLPKGSEGDRILIATHELIWMILDQLAGQAKVAMPEVAKTGARSDADLAPLLIVTIKRPSRS